MKPFRTLGPRQPWLRYGLVAGTWALYLATVWWTQERYELVLRPLASIPVLVTGVLLGWRTGLAASLAAPPVILSLHVAHGNGGPLLDDLSENLWRWIVGVLLGWGSGFMAEQVFQGRAAQERLNSAAAMHQSLKAGLEEAQAIAHIGSWEADTTTRETHWSNECWRLLGLPKGSVRPSLDTFLERVHPDDRKRVRGTIDTALAEMRITEFEYRVVRPDGQVRHVLGRNVPTAVLDGRVVRLSGTAQDVTEAKAVQDRLRDSEERFREIAESIQEAFWVCDPSAGSVLYVSPAYESIWGRPASSLRQWPGDWLGAVHRDDRGRVAAAAAAVCQPGGSYDVEYRALAADGSERWIHDRAFAVLDGGRVARVVGVAEDVTARRAMARRAADTARRLATVIAASPLPIIQAGPDLAVTAWNPAAQRLFGWTEEEARGRAAGLIVPDSDAAETQRAWEALRAGRGVVREDVPRVRKDGSEVRVDVYLSPLMGDDHSFQGIVGIVLDLAAQHEAEANRQRAQRLEEVAAFKTQFLNNAAHELATPLTPIKLQVASLRRDVFGALSPRQHDAVGLIERNLHRLGRLVQDLLDAARLQSGHLQVMLRPVEPGRIAQDVVASFAEKARQDGVALAVRRLDSPVQTLGDETRLTQVLFNLVHNALKFTPRGGRVEVALDARGGEVVLSVADTGAGMTGEQMSRLFHPFTQVHDPTVHDVGGTGLGLYISQGIVEQHGGQLLCHSDGRGRGTTFEVHLPLRAVETPDAAPRRRGEREREREGPGERRA